jgi:lysophospholipase L1-like esterase
MVNRMIIGMVRALSCFITFILLTLVAAPVTAQQPVSGPVAAPAGDCAELPALKERVKRAETRLSDWAQLGRYREDNARVLAQAARDPHRVVFMGDSITDGWASRPALSGGFFPGKPYVDRGIDGQKTGQMVVRFRQDVIELSPAVVVILAGTNDIVDNKDMGFLKTVEDNLATMAELACAHHIRPVFASLLPVSDYGVNREGKPINQTTRRSSAQIRAINDWLKEFTRREGFVYIDYYSSMIDANGVLQKGISFDGLHPNAKGYAIMAPLVEEAIARSLKSKPRCGR